MKTPNLDSLDIAPIVYGGSEKAKAHPEKIDLTAIAERLDESLLLKLAGAEAMRGLGKKEEPLEFQSLLAALALKGGLAYEAWKHLVSDFPHVKTAEQIEAAQEFQKQYLLVRNAGIQTATCVVKALQGTIDPEINDLGELGERGLFHSRDTHTPNLPKYARSRTRILPSLLLESLDDYRKIHQGLELRTAHRLLEEFQRTIKTETDRFFQLLQEKKRKTKVSRAMPPTFRTGSWVRWPRSYGKGPSHPRSRTSMRLPPLLPPWESSAAGKFLRRVDRIRAGLFCFQPAVVPAAA